MKYDIKILRKENIPKVIDLYKKFIKDQMGKNKYCKKESVINEQEIYEYYNQFLTSKREELFLAFDNKNEIIGFAAVSVMTPGFLFEFEKYGYIFDFFVKEEYRTFSLSLKLFKSCENWAKAHECKYLTAYTYYFNEKVKNRTAVWRGKDVPAAGGEVGQGDERCRSIAATLYRDFPSRT